MGKRKGNKWKDVLRNQQSPLNAAISARDSDVLTMVSEAVKHKQVALAYQPVVSALKPEHPAFYEGLIRIFDETGRIIPAKDFIEQIEATELGRVIDCLALEFGFRALAQAPTLRLSINMSARSIGFPRWMRTLHRGLEDDPTAAERLILEITESSAMTVPDLVVGFMSDLQRKGISFALDDFGAGYTSFRYLKDFYFDILKIDGQFIRNIHTDPDNQVLTRALVGIAQQFDMFTVAESVETYEDYVWLQGIGVDCLQGYYFGAPTIQEPWKQNSKATQRRRA